MQKKIEKNSTAMAKAFWKLEKDGNFPKLIKNIYQKKKVNIIVNNNLKKCFLHAIKNKAKNVHSYHCYST